MLNRDLLFSFPCCLLLDGPVKENHLQVMVDHLQSRGTPCRLCTSDVKVRGTLSKMDVLDLDRILDSISSGYNKSPSKTVTRKRSGIHVAVRSGLFN